MKQLHEMSILVVDDDRLIRKVVHGFLDANGYSKVSSADSGASGLKQLAEQQPDLILLDIMMPGINGYEFCRQVRMEEAYKNIPVIFMTALNDSETLKKCFDVGATDFVGKPLSYIEFISRVRSALRLKQSFDQIAEELWKRKQAEEKIKHQNVLLNNAHCELEELYQKLQREYEIAAEVFLRVTSNTQKKHGNLKFFSAPMEKVGGDVFLVAPRPCGGTNFLLGDFTGHGLSAALGAIPTSEIFHRMTGNDHSIGEIAAEMNRALKATLPTGLFLCACLIGLNADQDEVTLWNGGLPDVLIVGGEQGKTAIRHRLPSTHLPLGIASEEEFEDNCEMLRVTRNDRIYAYSDGIVESRNASGEMFGQERLEMHFGSIEDPDVLFDALCSSFRAFLSHGQQEDDYMIVEIKCHSLQDSTRGTPSTSGFHSHFNSMRMAFEYGPHQFRTDPIPHLIRILMESSPLRNHRENLCLILSELFINAVDYGVLALDPAFKSTLEGFEQYHIMRQELLSKLDAGWIRIALDLKFFETGGELLVRIEDSGSGFDWHRRSLDFPEPFALHGRGLPLVRSLCRSLVFNEKGNCAEAIYAW